MNYPEIYNLIAENPNTAFVVIGILSNFITPYILAMLEVIKRLFMSEAQNMAIMEFSNTRLSVIIGSNSNRKLMLSNLQVLLPFYVTYLSFIRLYYLVRYKGSFGVIGGIVAFDKYSILNLIEYKFENRE